MRIKARKHLDHSYFTNGQFVDYAPHGVFYLSIGECQREPGQPIDEAVTAAQEFAANTDGPLWLCMSGGVDSECMAQAFMKAEVQFRVAILRFEDDLNHFDICDAVEFCKTHQLEYQLFNLDIIHFYESGRYLEFAIPYRCNSPQLCAHLYLLSQLDGHAILSGNIVRVCLNASGKVILSFPHDLYFCYERFFAMKRQPGVGLFFLHTPELIYSFFRLPRMQELIFQKGQMHGREMDYAAKCQLYRDGGFDVNPRQDKFTGFEEVKRRIAERSGLGESAYDQLYRKPLQKIFPLARRSIFDVSYKFFKVDTIALPTDRQEIAQNGNSHSSPGVSD